MQVIITGTISPMKVDNQNKKFNILFTEVERLCLLML
jgi:hypothetical protein